MKSRTVTAIKRAIADLIEHAVMLKLFLPSRRDSFADVPCLTDAVRNLREEISAIEDLVQAEFPRKPGEDVLWRHFAFEVPPDHHPVLVSLRGHHEAVCARWIDARWFHVNGLDLWGEVYAWSPMPASCYAQRERLLLMSGQERSAA